MRSSGTDKSSKAFLKATRAKSYYFLTRVLIK